VDELHFKIFLIILFKIKSCSFIIKAGCKNMVKKQWAIIEEVEKLTEENASDFLAPSVYGQVKIKGKFIRDEQGKLVPVLVKTRRQVQIQQPATVKDEKETIRKSEKNSQGIIDRLKQWLHSFLC
jgi:hypothetical protein